MSLLLAALVRSYWLNGSVAWPLPRVCVRPSRKKEHNAPKQMAALEETCRLHFDALKAFQSSGVKRVDIYDYFSKLNPEFLLDIAKEYLSQVPVFVFRCPHPRARARIPEHACVATYTALFDVKELLYGFVVTLG